MQALYTIQEIAVLLIQISVFLIALLVAWVLVLAGAELYRDKKKELCRKESVRGRRRKNESQGRTMEE